MSLATFKLGLRHCPSRASTLTLKPTSTSTSLTSISSLTAIRQISCTAFTPSQTSTASKQSSCSLRPSSRLSFLQFRHASTTVDPIRANPNQPTANTVLDWNAFFRLRTSRRRYSVVSSILSSILVTGSAFVFLSTQPEMADEITKLIPLDPVISMGLLTFAATFTGWLIGPVFGNTLWKLFHRSRLPEFVIKDKAFFERIKRHRVNPMGASANNPVPDYYGEKIGSVSGYRRWLKDQRAFNRKREGLYPGGI